MYSISAESFHPEVNSRYTLGVPPSLLSISDVLCFYRRRRRRRRRLLWLWRRLWRRRFPAANRGQAVLPLPVPFDEHRVLLDQPADRRERRQRPLLLAAAPAVRHCGGGRCGVGRGDRCRAGTSIARPAFVRRRRRHVRCRRRRRQHRGRRGRLRGSRDAGRPGWSAAAGPLTITATIMLGTSVRPPPPAHMYKEHFLRHRRRTHYNTVTRHRPGTYCTQSNW